MCCEQVAAIAVSNGPELSEFRVESGCDFGQDFNIRENDEFWDSSWGMVASFPCDSDELSVNGKFNLRAFK